MDPEAPSLNGLRRALSKARSTDALMNIRGSDATHKALPGSRSTTILGPLPRRGPPGPEDWHDSIVVV